eukprot:SAG31_NODE_10858_length_1089_cov_2.058586_2_plen_39_part_01
MAETHFLPCITRSCPYSTLKFIKFIAFSSLQFWAPNVNI